VAEPVSEFWSSLSAFHTSLRKSKTINVNRQSERDTARHIVQLYFRETRPTLLQLGISEEQLNATDSGLQKVLELANSVSTRKAYQRAISQLIRARNELELRVHVLVGQRSTGASIVAGGDEARILQTLQQMLPLSAAAYQQALIDLSSGPRLSYRGIAVELREVLREVLDHLAPDEDVEKSPNFRLEHGRDKPTMAQKARHILHSRRSGSNEVKTTADAIDLIDGMAGNLVRTIYSRGAAAVHVPPAATDVQVLRMQINASLATLLNVFSP